MLENICTSYGYEFMWATQWGFGNDIFFPFHPLIFLFQMIGNTVPASFFALPFHFSWSVCHDNGLTNWNTGPKDMKAVNIGLKNFSRCCHCSWRSWCRSCSWNCRCSRRTSTLKPFSEWTHSSIWRNACENILNISCQITVMGSVAWSRRTNQMLKILKMLHVERFVILISDISQQWPGIWKAMD